LPLRGQPGVLVIHAMIRTRWCIAVLAFATAWPGAAAAADLGAYPSRPIHLVVPTAPGGAGDALARESALRLSQALHAPVVVENRPGASGMLGTESVARAAPDGYTLLFMTSATHLIAPAVAGSARYDPVADFEPVIDLGYAMSVVMVASDLPISTLGELVDYARAHPGALAYASSGAGSANHLDTEVLASLTGMLLLHVPYRGTADGYRALVAGEVQVMIGAITSAQPHIAAGKVRPLAVMARARSPLLPAVPTLAELGFGDADVRKWMGIAAPAHTPRAVVASVNGALAHMLATASMRAWMQKNGFEVTGGTPAEFRRIVVEDDAKWNGIVGRVVREAR
jgi:tripartite-type tricarboxylate transporter receptor subunit TctC